MTHRPEAEEFLQHLIGVDHACSEAISLRQSIMNDVANRRWTTTLIPAEGSLQIDVTAEVADEVARRISEFQELHNEHHLTPGLLEDTDGEG